MVETLDSEARFGKAREPNYERLSGRPLGEIMVALGLATQDEVNAALDEQVTTPEERLGEILVRMKVVDARDVAKALGVQLEMPFLESISIENIPDEFVQAVPIAFAKQNNILPVSRLGDSIVAAVANPLLSEAIDDIGLLLGARISPAVAMADVITEAINRVYDRATGLAHEAVQRLQSDDDEDGDLDAIDLIDDAGTDDAPIIRFVNALLRDAVRSAPPTFTSSATSAASWCETASTACSTRRSRPPSRPRPPSSPA